MKIIYFFSFLFFHFPIFGKYLSKRPMGVSMANYGTCASVTLVSGKGRWGCGGKGGGVVVRVGVG